MNGLRLIPGLLAPLALFLAMLAPVTSAHAQAPAPPGNVVAIDHDWDNGKKVDLSWDLSPDDATIDGYQISMATFGAFERVDTVPAGTVVYAPTDLEAGKLYRFRMRAYKGSKKSKPVYGEPITWNAGTVDLSWGLSPDESKIDGYEISIARFGDFKIGDIVPAGTSKYLAKELQEEATYRFRIQAFRGTARSTPVDSEPILTTLEFFDGARGWLFIITFIFCGAVIYWIYHARSGRPLKVRKIAGLEAVDEAVGRATEMGRSVLYIPGIQDINEIQTIASMTILARVAKTAAEYGAKVEVPTSRSLVMTTARETVQAAFLAAGRPDAYNKDLIYYVTDEQFGYVAYLQGMMVREKPAACFYMGAFFAESLILAETGNSIGAIQVAGTAMPAQLPFFVAACDYTLIGEEFFAASAYLSGSAEELGSLKGQDVGKVIVAVLLLIGVALATGASMLGPDSGLGQKLELAVDFLKHSILT